MGIPRDKTVPLIPDALEPLDQKDIIGTSYGLLGLIGEPNCNCFDCDCSCDVQQIFYFWNPAIRRTLSLPVPVDLHVAFGVCQTSLNLKVLAYPEVPDVASLYYVAERDWRDIEINLPFENSEVNWVGTLVTTDGYSYWLARIPNEYQIVSFNYTTETFDTINLPPGLPYGRVSYMISKVRGHLALVQKNVENITNVWIMDDVGAHNFTPIFTLASPHEFKTCTKNGGLLMEMEDEHFELVYQTLANLQEHQVLEACHTPFEVHSYEETLLLFDQEGSATY